MAMPARLKKLLDHPVGGTVTGSALGAGAMLLIVAGVQALGFG